MEEKIYQQCMDYALYAIQRKRYTTDGMRKKLDYFLKKKEIDGSEVKERVISRLIELNYLNDQEFARDFVSDRIKFRPKGKFVILRELKAKGVSKDLASSAIEVIDEVEVGERLLLAKMSKWAEEPLQKQKEKAYRFLVARGFGGDAIYKILHTCYNRSS